MFPRTLALALALACAELCRGGGVAAAQQIKSDDVITTLETAYEKASQKAGAAVVAIKVDREAEPVPKAPQAPPGMRGRFGMPEDVFAKRPTACCSGVIVEPTGTILTTWFNVSGKIKSIKVMLPDGREMEAQLLGYNGT